MPADIRDRIKEVAVRRQQDALFREVEKRREEQEKKDDSFISTLLRTNAHNNYVVNVLGSRGVTGEDLQVNAPELTNVPNALIVNAHGSRAFEGFSAPEGYPSPRAVDEGFNLSQIAHKLGPMTNEIKRAFILSCYAGGYSPDAIKAVFPNVEQIVTPRRSQPTSGVHLPSLVTERYTPLFGEAGPSFSPYFSITPQKTNAVYSAPDWLGTNKFFIQRPVTADDLDYEALLRRRGETNRLTSPNTPY
jgi:hypothetical protein